VRVHRRLGFYPRSRMPAAALMLSLISLPALLAQGRSPTILFWTAYPYTLPHITHFTPNIGLGPTSETFYSQQDLLAHGIMPLKSAAGKIDAKRLTVQELAQRWSSGKVQGYVGIAIDEFGSNDSSVNANMLEALAIARRDSPGLFIAIWHGGRLTPRFAEAYRRDADLVLLETYIAGKNFLRWRFGLKLDAARQAGILDKTVIALGINDIDKRLGTTMQPWANTSDELQAQMRWIRSYAPTSPGIAFFASHASFEIQRRASELAWSIFSGQ
jgi:hypothetical protein